MAHTDRVVVLVDMDCFYCQVEEKLDPQLMGRSIAVVQYNAWKGGGIIAVNYPARERGVTRHMRGDEAKLKCPEIELVRVPTVRGKADLTKYREGGKQVAQVLRTFTPLLQRASVDEAYLDITEAVNKKIATLNREIVMEDLLNTHVVGCDTVQFLENVYNNDLHVESNLRLIVGGSIVEEIRRSVYTKTGYRCSAGIAHNKILAKLACGMHKPNKQTILPHEGIEELYKNLPLKKIKSLGGKFGITISEELRIKNMSELFQFTEQDLMKKYDEKNAKWLYNIARGIDLEPVTPRLVSKSIGCCKRFPGKTALKTTEEVTHWLSELVAEITERLEQDIEENNRKAKNITISFTQEINQKDTTSSRTQALNSYNSSKIMSDTLETLKKYTQKPNGSFAIKFLGLSAGKFESCKNVGDISNFFKVMGKNIKTAEKIHVEIIKENKETKLNAHDFNIKEFDSKETQSKNLLNSFEASEHNTNKQIIDEDDQRYIDNEIIRPSINLFDFERDTENSNYSNLDDDDSKSTIILDYTEKLDNKLEYPNRLNDSRSSSPIDDLINGLTEMLPENIVNSDIGDTSKSFFMRHLKSFNTEQMEKSKTDALQECEQPIIEIDEISNISITESIGYDKCPECDKFISKNDFISHADHHMALKLMEEEKQTYREKLQENKQSKSRLTKSKPVKRKLAQVDNTIASFFAPKPSGKNLQLCTECNKSISKDEFASHLDFHVAKKLHLELNPMKQVNRNINNKKCANGSNLMNFFKPLT